MTEHLDSARDEVIQSNEIKLGSILKTIIYYGTNDLSLRRKLAQSGNFEDLVNFRVDSCDKILEKKKHLKTHI